MIEERGQQRPADWPKAFPAQKYDVKDIPTPPEQWTWVKMATVGDLQPTDEGTSCASFARS